MTTDTHAAARDRKARARGKHRHRSSGRSVFVMDHAERVRANRRRPTSTPKEGTQNDR